MTTARLVDRLMAQFDLSQADALEIVDAAHKRAVAESGFRSSTVDIGVTVAGTANYALPDGVVSLRRIRVLGSDGYAMYDPVDISALWDLDAGNATLSGEGVFAEDADTSGAAQIRLEPAPDTSGLHITGMQTLEPADLVYASGSPIIPADFHLTLLYELAQAIAFSQSDERDDVAASHFQAAAAEIERLRGRKLSRTTTDRERIGVWGYDWR